MSGAATEIDTNDEKFWLDLKDLIFGPTQMSCAEDEVDAVLELTGTNAPASVLDAGCGLGRHTERLVHAGLHTEGIDRVDILVGATRNRLRGIVDSTLIHCGDMMTFDGYRSSRFDLILSLYHSLGYSPDARHDHATLKRFYDLLAPSGQLCMELIDPDGFKPGEVRQNTFIFGGKAYHDRVQVCEERRHYTWSVQEEAEDSPVYVARHRLFSKKAMNEMLKGLGFTTSWPDLAKWVSYERASAKYCVIAKRSSN